MKKRVIKNKEHVAVIKKRYGPKIDDYCGLYGSDGTVVVPIFLHSCTNPNCDEIETKEKQFKRCKRCYSVYCSEKCSLDDWKNGCHKQVCKYESYTIHRDLYYKKLDKQGKYTPRDMLFGNKKLETQWKNSKLAKKLSKNKPPENYKRLYQNYY